MSVAHYCTLFQRVKIFAPRGVFLTEEEPKKNTRGGAKKIGTTQIKCANPNCTNVFPAFRGSEKYCSTKCSDAVHKQKLAIRKAKKGWKK